MSFLLDTCFVSELGKPKCNPGVIDWLASQEETELFLCAVTLGELDKGLSKQRDATRRKRLRQFIEQEIFERFKERTLAVDEAVWRRWGALCGEADRAGNPLPVLDALLAAVAQVHGLTVVTRNDADFSRCEVAVINPWTD